METDYTAADAKRLLGLGISDDQACGHCDGTCLACLTESAEVIAQVKSEALKEAAIEWRKHLHETGASYVCAEAWLNDRADTIIKGDTNDV